MNDLSILNRQKICRINLSLLRTIFRFLLDQSFRVKEARIWLHLIDRAAITRLNGQYLKHDGSTDVITFDYSSDNSESPDAMQGEIFISVDDAVSQSRQFQTSLPSELVRYLIHGLLHLQGYDDQEPTARRLLKRSENGLLKKITNLFPLEQLTEFKQADRPSPGRLKNIGFAAKKRGRISKAVYSNPAQKS